MSSGMEISGGFGMSKPSQTRRESWPDSAPSESGAQLLHLGAPTASPGEPFEQLVRPFETAFVRYMRDWTMEGKPRTGRRYSQYTNCPVPTPEERLLFILSYLKVAALQVAHGAMFEMSQSNANKWIHVLLPTLHQTLIDLGDLPARHLVAL